MMISGACVKSGRSGRSPTLSNREGEVNHADPVALHMMHNDEARAVRKGENRALTQMR